MQEALQIAQVLAPVDAIQVFVVPQRVGGAGVFEPPGNAREIHGNVREIVDRVPHTDLALAELHHRERQLVVPEGREARSDELALLSILQLRRLGVSGVVELERDVMASKRQLVEETREPRLVRRLSFVEFEDEGQEGLDERERRRRLEGAVQAERSSGRTESKSRSVTARTSLWRRVTTAAVRPNAQTNSTSSPSGS